MLAAHENIFNFTDAYNSLELQTRNSNNKYISAMKYTTFSPRAETPAVMTNSASREQSIPEMVWSEQKAVDNACGKV